MNKQSNWQLVSVETFVALALVFGFASTTLAAAELPTFKASNFSNPTNITNPWFALPVGREFEYEGETDEGMETIEIEITGETKKVLGIKTLVTIWGKIMPATSGTLGKMSITMKMVKLPIMTVLGWQESMVPSRATG